MADMPSRRKALANVRPQPPNNASLWLDRYLSSQGGDESDAKTRHVKDVATEIDIPPSYRLFFARWEQALADLGVEPREAQSDGRLVLGLDGESVIETSISLHRTYGVPYIPGSALKGLAAAYAHQRLGGDWAKGQRYHNVMFGSTDTAGYVTFFDAWFVPGTGKGPGNRPLATDIISIHHKAYYEGTAPPADWDKLTLVPFLAATGSYLIALGGLEKWVQRGYDILECALRDMGIGAKTSSGYGRMHLSAPSSGAQDHAPIAHTQQADQLSEPSQNQPSPAIVASSATMRALVMGAGSTDASLKRIGGGRLGRVPCSPALPRPLRGNDTVIVRLGKDGSPEEIIGIVESGQ